MTDVPATGPRGPDRDRSGGQPAVVPAAAERSTRPRRGHPGRARAPPRVPQGGVRAARRLRAGADRHPATDRSHRFDEFGPGLDHLSFGCADRSELEKWQKRLDELGISHGVIAEDAFGFALAFRDPDNIALEFWAPRS